MVVPTFSALLSDASRQQSRDLSPIFSSVLLYEMTKELIFLFWPTCTNHVISICQLKKSLVTLNFRLSKYFADTIPRLITVLLHIL